MMPATRNLSALTLVAAALALPAGAQASPSVSADATIKASARAELHLEQAQQLVNDTGAAAQVKARALLARSRSELRSAVVKAGALAEQADTDAAVDAAVTANVQVSSTLAADAEKLANIAIEGKGRLESKAAAALVSDMRMARNVLTKTIALAGRAGAATDAVLEAAKQEQQDTTVAVDASAEVVSSLDVGAKAKASADVAVGMGTQAIAAAAQQAQTIESRVEGSAKTTLVSLQQLLSGAAARISNTIAASNIGDDEVTVSGHGNVTLSTLAKLGLDLTGSAAVTAPGPGGDAHASGSFDLLARLRAVR
jgi:hypothetical protein